MKKKLYYELRESRIKNYCRKLHKNNGMHVMKWGKETPVKISKRTSNKTSFLKERHTAVSEGDKCVIHFRISTTGTLGLVGFKNKLQVNNARYHVHGCNRCNTPFTTLCVDSNCVIGIRFLLNFSKLTHNL